MEAQHIHHSMTHDGPLVLLSFIVALFASYTALDMGTRLRRAAGKARILWLGGSAVVLGGGIWSMHFIAMLAFNAGVPIGYDFDLTALSLLIAIGIMAVGFHLVTRTNPSIARQLLAGCIVGSGVAIMHYTGMGALTLAGAIHYNPVLVAASVLVAIVAATAALWLTLNLTRPWQRVAAAAVMAVAVCGMHYTAMLATSIDIQPGQMAVGDPLSSTILAAAVSIGLFLILCLAMVCVFVDRRFELLAEREAESLRAANLLLRGEIEERQAIALELSGANAELIATQGAIRNLLDNSDQGFLTVASNLLVDDQSSAACEAILGEAPAGKSIIDLVCQRSTPDDKSAMRATLESVFRDSDDFIRELKLGLLPAAFDIEGKSVKASYKFLANGRQLMLILTDVTQTRLLTETVESERQRLEMIVLAITEGEAFAALVNDYRTFLADKLPLLVERIEETDALGELLRDVHTYKGLLAQFSFQSSPGALHALETAFSTWTPGTTGLARDLVGLERLHANLERDLARVTDALGADFLDTGRRVTLSQRQLQSMQQVALATLAGDEGRAVSPPLRLLLQTLAGSGLLDAKAALALHGRGARALAARLHKQLAPIVVRGDDVALPAETYGEFFRSLVHVFRNAVDHGIEEPDDRALAGKPADGAIRCTLHNLGDWLEILIEDDGPGVDRPALENKLIAAGQEKLLVEGLSLEDLVFRNGLSSRGGANEISGRGVGLAAVKLELERLGGSVTVESDHSVGTRFHFRLPSPRADILATTAPAAKRIAT